VICKRLVSSCKFPSTGGLTDTSVSSNLCEIRYFYVYIFWSLFSTNHHHNFFIIQVHYSLQCFGFTFTCFVWEWNLQFPISNLLLFKCVSFILKLEYSFVEKFINIFSIINVLGKFEDFLHTTVQLLSAAATLESRVWTKSSFHCRSIHHRTRQIIIEKSVNVL
jgi:hypothetical protein